MTFKSIKYVFLLFLFSNSLNAKHIVGGDITYECIGIDTVNNTFNIKIIATVYRDNVSQGAQFDGTGSFGIFEGNNLGWTKVATRPVTLESKKKLQIINPNPCLEVPDNIGVDEGRYVFFLRDLPISNKSYYIVYQRCCRNETISNIYSPGDAGAAFSIEIFPEAQKTCNNSPVFKQFPPIVICANDALSFDHSASDNEGDQITYSFCAPLHAGGKRGSNGGGGAEECDGVRPNSGNCPPPYAKVRYKVPTYTELQPIPGNPAISIDPITGLITGYPTVQGQFVVGVCAKEYRDGKLIGEIRRDFQFNITKCDPLVYADIIADSTISPQVFNIVSCGENTITINNKSYLESNIKEYLWQFDIGGTQKTFTSRNVSVTFPDTGTYTGLMILNPNTPCSDSADFEINIYPSIETDFNFAYDTCFAGPVNFEDLTVTGSDKLVSWSWDMAGESRKTEQDPEHTFSYPGLKRVSLTSTDVNGCKDTKVKDVRYFPVPTILIVEPSSFIGCAPGSVLFNNLTSPIDTNYTLNWDFGDGTKNEGNTISPSHTYTDPGTYNVNLEIITPIGCQIAKSFPSWIRIKDKPLADFTFSPTDPTVFNNKVQFNNLSQDATGYSWHFGDAGISFIENPQIAFQDTGNYKIRLIVKNKLNCTDTMFSELYVIAPVLLHFPNAFTPNNDALNDEFKPKGYFDVIEGYEMVIYNRWGERIFISKDPDIGWNGQKNNSGALSPIGVYIFQAKYFDEYGNIIKVEDHVNLIR